jgi:flagellar basal-body rod protein FlgC
METKTKKLAAATTIVVIGLFACALCGCSANPPAGSYVTVLTSADPAASEIVDNLRLKRVPVRADDAGNTRIFDGPECRKAICQMMSRARQRLDICSRNIANVNTTRDADGKPNPYRRQFIRNLATGESVVARDGSPFRTKYEPGHPDADSNGTVRYPNVDVPVEYMNAVEATREYELALAILNRFDPSIVAASPRVIDK